MKGVRVPETHAERVVKGDLLRSALHLLHHPASQDLRARLVVMTQVVRTSLEHDWPIPDTVTETDIDDTCQRLVRLSLVAWQGDELYRDEEESNG